MLKILEKEKVTPSLLFLVIIGVAVIVKGQENVGFEGSTFDNNEALLLESAIRQAAIDQLLANVAGIFQPQKQNSPMVQRPFPFPVNQQQNIQSNANPQFPNIFAEIFSPPVPNNNSNLQLPKIPNPIADIFRQQPKTSNQTKPQFPNIFAEIFRQPPKNMNPQFPNIFAEIFRQPQKNSNQTKSPFPNLPNPIAEIFGQHPNQNQNPHVNELESDITPTKSTFGTIGTTNNGGLLNEVVATVSGTTSALISLIGVNSLDSGPLLYHPTPTTTSNPKSPNRVVLDEDDEDNPKTTRRPFGDVFKLPSPQDFNKAVQGVLTQTVQCNTIRKILGQCS